MRWIGTLLVIAACHDGGGAAIDGPAGTPDTSELTPGVFVSWHAQPGLPGPISDAITVTTAELSVGLFELVSPQGDVQSTRFDLAWGTAAPAQTVFEDAPPGEYQLAKLKLDGSSHAVEIRGTWKVGPVTKTFRIETKYPFPTKQLTFSKTLDVGGTLPLGIQFNLAAALTAIDFAMLPIRHVGGNDDDADLQLEDDNPVQMTPFRIALFGGIALAN